MFTEKDFGKPISTEMSQYISILKVNGNIKEIAEKHSYNPITLTAVVMRYRNLTEANSEMIIDLIGKCIENYSKIEGKREAFQKSIKKAI